MMQMHHCSASCILGLVNFANMHAVLLNELSLKLDFAYLSFVVTSFFKHEKI